MYGLGWWFLALCVLLAVGWAAVDEDWHDRLTWTSRSYQYPNGITLFCGVDGKCHTMTWDPRRADDRSAVGLVLQLPGGAVSSVELADEARLRALGWRIELALSGESALATGTPDMAEPYVQASFTNGLPWRVLVRTGLTVAITTGDRSFSLPVRRRELSAKWGPWLTEFKKNAINGG